jgi:hypothetical protein
MRKIERAMKRPEFQGLMNDYMKEISDPKNREVIFFRSSSNSFRNTMSTLSNSSRKPSCRKE